MTLAAISSEPWDIVVVGAGPAGATAALLLARQGRRVLLVDRARFPREKACGCCLGARGVRLARALGLGSVLEDGVTLNSVELRRDRRSLRLGIPEGLAMARGRLDSGLGEAAIAEGVTFLDGCCAHLLPADGQWRGVRLARGSDQVEARAVLVLACDGLHGNLLDAETGCRWHVAADAWMGAAVTLDHDEERCPENTICMHLGAGGYVGAVRLADGQLHLAAALDPKRCRELGGPVEMIRRILRDAAAWDVSALEDGHVMGTPLLTRMREAFGAHRVLALGDACAYVEPFTGEGMTWAMESADALARFLPASLSEWPEDMQTRWTVLQRRTLRKEQSLCKLLRWLLHRPTVSGVAMQVAEVFPAIARMAVAKVSCPMSEVVA